MYWWVSWLILVLIVEVIEVVEVNVLVFSRIIVSIFSGFMVLL